MAGRPSADHSITSDTFPIRVHWTRAQDEEKAAAIRAALELSWSVQVDTLGFNPPVLPDAHDGDEMDLYLDAVGWGSAYALNDANTDVVPGDGFNGASAYMVVDHNLPDAWIDSYVAHEFNHVLQYATDYTELTLPLWEAVATATQTWTLGEAGAWDYDVASFQEIPWAPTLTGDSTILWPRDRLGYTYEYGAALWIMHLDRHYGNGDGTMGPALWRAAANEGPKNEPDVVDAIVTVTQVDLGEFMNSMARVRWLTGDRWTPDGLAEAEEWDETFEVPVDTVVTDASVPATVRFQHPPNVYGQAFVQVSVSDATLGPLTLRLTSEAGVQGSMLAMVNDGTGAWEDQSWGANATLELGLSGAAQVIVAVTNLGADGFDGDSWPYAAGDLVLHVDLANRPEIDDDTGGSALDDPPVETPATCGCSTGAPGGWFVLPMWILWSTRRRCVPERDGGS